MHHLQKHVNRKKSRGTRFLPMDLVVSFVLLLKNCVLQSLDAWGERYSKLMIFHPCILDHFEPCRPCICSKDRER